MANPLANEEEIYKKIEDENITIHPLVWELLSHHISNDLYIITIILASALGKVSQSPKPLSPEKAQKIYERVLVIKTFLEKLRKATRKDARF